MYVLQVDASGARRHDAAAAAEWATAAAKLGRELLVKHGLDVASVDVALHVRPCEGLVRQLDGSVEKRFSKAALLYPIQATLRRNVAPDPRLEPKAAAARLGALEFRPGSQALFLGRAHYGCVATVLPSASPGLSKQGKQLAAAPSRALRVHVEPAPPATASAASTAKRLLTGVTTQFLQSGQVARRLGIDPRTLGKLTGNVYVVVRPPVAHSLLFV